jgi:CBS domain containing-hemolysin-like protein
MMSEAPQPEAVPEAEKPSLLRRLSFFVRGDSPSAAQMRESLEEVIEESDRQSPALSAPERKMLANLLKFGELRVSDVMVPRADIVAVDEDTSLPDFIALFREVQHSRLPVYRETLDVPTGLVHIKDILAYMQIQPDGSFRWRDGPISQFKRELLFVPPSMPLVDLLLKMQTMHTHLALVIDEYGGTDGIVSIEDIVEEIVGDIADEHDEEAARIRKSDDGTIIADARTDLEDFRNQTGIALAPEDADQEVDTLGGLVVSLLGRLPQRGEIVAHPSGYEFEVLEADPRRVKRLRLRDPARRPGVAEKPA